MHWIRHIIYAPENKHYANNMSGLEDSNQEHKLFHKVTNKILDKLQLSQPFMIESQS